MEAWAAYCEPKATDEKVPAAEESVAETEKHGNSRRADKWV